MSRITSTRMRGLWIPDTLYVKMRYRETFNAVNPSGSSCDVRQIRGNALWDPDRTGIGHQPMGYDQYCALYSKWVVLGSSIKVESYNTVTRVGKVVVIPSLDAFTNATVLTHNISEQPYARQMLYGIAAGQGKARLKHYCSTKKMFGHRYIQDENYYGVISADPPTANQWYWNIVHQDGLYGTTNGFVNSIYTVTVIYYVRYFNRVDQVISSEDTVTTTEDAVDHTAGAPSGLSLGGL